MVIWSLSDSNTSPQCSRLRAATFTVSPLALEKRVATFASPPRDAVATLDFGLKLPFLAAWCVGPVLFDDD